MLKEKKLPLWSQSKSNKASETLVSSENYGCDKQQHQERRILKFSNRQVISLDAKIGAHR